MSTKTHANRLPVWLYVMLAITAWYAVWMSTQALFMTDVPVLTALIASSPDIAVRFATLSAWIIGTGIIATLLWAKWSGGDFSFLRIKRPMVLMLAYLPIAIVAVIVMLTRSPFGVPGWLWISCLVATTFYQDILTFGFLQTALEKRVRPIVAALLTALVFFSGHFWLIGNMPTLATAGMYMVAFPIFALLRYKTKTIYATNLIHTAFHVISGLL